MMPLAEGSGARLIRGLFGLGDQVYARGFLYEMARHGPVWYPTPWAELFFDRPAGLHLVRDDGNLWTQRYALDRTAFKEWSEPPVGTPVQDLFYWGNLETKRKWPERYRVGWTVLDEIAEQTGVPKAAIRFGFRPDGIWLDRAREVIARLDLGGRRLIVVRPPTIGQWKNQARNPAPGTMDVILRARREGCFFLGIGALVHEPAADRYETLDGFDASLLDGAFLRSELHWTTIAGLMSVADLTVTSVCFALPLGIAVGARLLAIYGGHVPTEILTDPVMGLERYHYVAPEPFCFCAHRKHKCANKEIPRERILAGFAVALAQAAS